MKYRIRHAEKRLKRLAEHFKVVLVTGSRQVGKSTLLSHVFPEMKVIIFDPIQDIHGARRDPDMFLNNHPAPVILDEVQYVPELLPALKRYVDRSENKGRYFLTGSQNLSVLRSVSESLAGRVGILQLGAMTLEEIHGLGDRDGWLGAYLDDPASLMDLFAEVIPIEGGPARRFWRGMLPGLLDIPDDLVVDYFSSYIQTYVERDVRVMEDIRQLSSFGRFLGLTAALTAQEINDAKLGRDVDVAPNTSRRWLNLLSGTFQWLELPAFHGNTIKRLSGKRKGYWRDTGLACYLQRISSPDALAVSPLLGAVFETWVVNHVHQQFVNFSMAPRAYHWRTDGGAEVDLLLERDGKLYPVEIKCKTNLTGYDARGLEAFRKTHSSRQIATGLIVYAGDTCCRINENTIAIPWNTLLDVK